MYPPSAVIINAFTEENKTKSPKDCNSKEQSHLEEPRGKQLARANEQMDSLRALGWPRRRERGLS